MNRATKNRTRKPLALSHLVQDQVEVEIDLHQYLTGGPLWHELAGERLGKAD